LLTRFVPRSGAPGGRNGGAKLAVVAWSVGVVSVAGFAAAWVWPPGTGICSIWAPMAGASLFARYRLYAIDRIISRVISYAIVTAVLAGVFAGSVLLATGVLPIRTPGAVAAATLAAAALFNPLRSRVQRTVDRKFNRSLYNAEAVVAAFTARLRQTVDLDTLQGDLLDAVYRAFEPASASVWLAASDRR
jgi:hypothetical protein